MRSVAFCRPAMISFLPLPLVVVKMLVDGTLFVLSYFVQRNWVFKRPARSQAVIVEGGDYGQKRSHSSFSAI